MTQGRVTWFSEPYGYGFIETPGGDRVLVRSSAIETDRSSGLREGQEVAFQLLCRNDGVLEAAAVRPVD